MRTLRLFLLALLGAAASVAAQPPNCSDGAVYDDGFFEDGDGLNEVNVARGGWLQLVESGQYPAKLGSVCICWIRTSSDSTISFDLGVWEYNALARGPGSLLGLVSGLQASGVPAFPANGQFYRYNVSSEDIIVSGPVLVGPIWRPRTDTDFFVCADKTPGTNKLRLEYLTSSSTDTIGVPFGPANTVTLTYALGIRPVFIQPDPPPPPPGDPAPPTGPWLTTSQLSGYQFKVRINGTALGTQVADCVPETLCVAGAIPTRSEIFLRIIGPRPNGFLWVQAIRFSTSHLEVWVQRLSSGQIRYYDFPGVPQDSADLPGLVDKQAFVP